ncbi:type VI secretion system amidase immunity protein Tai4 [Caballeronia sp. NK8]|nr:type VI secretion system amidase immunity protein Tai4 [Caballeronia sp. NK8]
MKRWFRSITLPLCFCCSAMAHQSAHASDSPEAYKRTFGQNFRDMVLAICVTTAYKNNAEVGKDAGSSVTGLIEWTYYDMDHPEAITALVKKYLSRDYFNPLAEAEVKGIRFDFLKCLDLYHSKELDRLVTRLVPHPNWTVRDQAKHDKR